VTWVKENGERASKGTFADTTAFGELVFNCTAGAASLAVLGQAGEEAVSGKVLVDVSNPLDFSRGRPPTLGICNTDSVGEQIQRQYPGARVVKTLNTINADVMVNPSLVPGGHDVFVCGNDEGAKNRVASLLESFGWPTDHIVDLGDITASRGTEMYIALWLRLMGALGTGRFNIHVVR